MIQCIGFGWHYGDDVRRDERACQWIV